jgi:hypothetical protein
MDAIAPYNNHAPFAAGSDTSEATAIAVNSKTATVRARVLDFITGARDGATQDEVSAKLNLLHQSASARIREMVLMGQLRDSGRRRLTRYGKSARVYEAT